MTEDAKLPKAPQEPDKVKPRKAVSARASKAPAPGLPPPAAPLSKIVQVRDAVRKFLIAELQAREVRITKLAPDGEGGWEVEADLLVLDLAVKRLGLPLTQEILEQQFCLVQLGPDLTVLSYEFIEPEDR